MAFGATDGEAGLKAFKEKKPDISLIDIYMPYSSLSGIEVLKSIKDIDKSALCIMLTFMGGEERIEECKKLGAEKYIRKPIEVDALTKIIEDILKHSKEVSSG